MPVFSPNYFELDGRRQLPFRWLIASYGDLCRQSLRALSSLSTTERLGTTCSALSAQ